MTPVSGKNRNDETSPAAEKSMIAGISGKKRILVSGEISESLPNRHNIKGTVKTCAANVTVRLSLIKAGAFSRNTAFSSKTGTYNSIPSVARNESWKDMS